MRIEVKVFEQVKPEEGMTEGTMKVTNIFEVDTELLGFKNINCAVLDRVCESLLGGEPVFVFRSQDKFSPLYIRAYRDFLKEKKNQVWKRVDNALRAINQWRKDNKDRIKVPD